MRPAGSLARLRRMSTRFWRRRQGTSAVEFALIAPLYFLLLLATLEMALINFSASTLRTGAAEASRLVKTGDAQCLTNVEFVAAMCNGAVFVPDCAARIDLNMWRFTGGFGGGRDAIDEFADINPGDVVLIEATYPWNVLTPWIDQVFADEDGDFAYQQGFLFRSEDFVRTAC